MAESELPGPLAYDIGFHLSDWHQDAAILVALHLFPERFTRGEVHAAVLKVLSHAPQHAATAAALYEMPVNQQFVQECIVESRRDRPEGT